MTERFGRLKPKWGSGEYTEIKDVERAEKKKLILTALATLVKEEREKALADGRKFTITGKVIDEFFKDEEKRKLFPPGINTTKSMMRYFSHDMNFFRQQLEEWIQQHKE